METTSELPSYYYLQPSKNSDGEDEEELFDSNGIHITSEYLNDAVAKSMSDRYTVVSDSPDGSSYKCNECNQMLHNTGHLVGHIVVHTGENPYVCSLCQRSFVNSTRLKLHLRVHCIQKPQPGLTVTRITKSPQTSTVPTSLSTAEGAEADHGEVPESERTFRCIECEQVFPKDELYRHMKQHLLEKNIFAQKPNNSDPAVNETSTDQQDGCSGSIKVSSEVELVPIRKPDAIANKKKIVENPILCGLLMRESNEPPPLNVATVELDSPGEEEEDDHGKDPGLVEDMNQLSEMVPSPEDAGLDSGGAGGFIISSVATVDQKFLESLAQMELQARTPELEELPMDDMLLENCGPNESNGQKHAGSATVCGLCGKSFHEPFGLRQHMRIMHAETKPFKCPECKKTFAQERSMYIHLRVHISQRPFICIVCYKTFTRSTALNGHMSCHAHDTIKCLECGELVTNISNYAKHVETRHPNFPNFLDQIRTDRPEHERSKILRRILMSNMASNSGNEQPGETLLKVEPTGVD
ncbi:AGAP008135-PA-like protein [Anopheles sinensis]|uniref:AGAP008135-PA-like protein n=1 Tax=Anopheles sinensis TaxID=74873 RepID=A0A084W880_ANOSI|nr:AGAP008135-PA-like protein [Anopheles sinensis]